jgi:hypothetical protein
MVSSLVVGGYWLVVIGWWLLVGGWWLLVGGYWLVVGGCGRLRVLIEDEKQDLRDLRIAEACSSRTGTHMGSICENLCFISDSAPLCARCGSNSAPLLFAPFVPLRFRIPDTDEHTF